LRAAAHVIEGKRVIDSNVIELHCGQVGLELPSFRIIKSLSHAAIRPEYPMLSIVRIDPDRVIVSVMINFFDFVQRLAAVQ